MATTTTRTQTAALEPIDRLEEKVKMLVSLISRLKTEQARTTEENARLSREVDALRARVADAETMTSEVTVLRQERDQIRARVSEMIQQLDTLNL